MKIRCSSLDRILNCGHSAYLPVEKSETVYAQAGTDQHILAHEFLTTTEVRLKRKVWDKMNKNTQLYVKYVHNIIAQGSQVHIEKYLIKEIRPGFYLHGTPDIWYCNNGKIEIVDLKNGFQEVLPLSNQLKGYAYLALMECLEEAKKVYEIKLTIVQNEKIESLEFLCCAFDELIPRIIEAVNSHSFETGEHCNFCPSKIHCIKMTDMIDYEDKIVERVVNKSHLKKTLDMSEAKLYNERPEWFIEKKWGKGTRRVFVGDNSSNL